MNRNQFDINFFQIFPSSHEAFPNKQCPPLTKKVEDINLMEQIALREKDPILYQNLFRDDYNKLHCDTANRLRNGNLWIEDIAILDKYGWTAKASELKAQVAEAEKQILEKKIAEAKARNDERDRKLAEYNKLDPMAKMAMNQSSLQALEQARREWGISS